tara:strand:+ start:2010 stop:2627 length:618 start_codon:yes stop_codon:yes gene_type:complete
MSKFNYLSLILISISIIFSFYDDFIYPRDINYDDYFPENKDKSIFNKLIWYLSQFTYQKQILIFIYFILKIFTDYNLETFLKILVSITISINIAYFKYLFPHYKKNDKTNYKLYELGFYDLFPHFIDTFIIIIEIWSLSNFSFSDIYLPLYFEAFMLISVIINYYLRGVWTYGFVNLKKGATYKLILEFLIYTHVISYIIYKIKN